MRSVQDIPLIGIGIGLIVVVGLIVGVGGVVTSDERPPIGQAPPITENITAEGELEAQSQSLSESPRTYAVTATSADAIDADQLAEYGDVGTQADDRIELRMSPSDVATVQNVSWVTNVRPVIRSEPTQTGTQTDIPGSSDGSPGSLGVQQAHQNGITGEDVEVGIIDKGFDPQNPAIASNVAETRSFRSSEADPTHGTSTAEIVTRTAPDAQLSLVSVSTATDIEAAIGYLRRQDVDVIVHSQGVPSFEDDGEHILTDNINTATDSGTLFVNAAGNEAQTHWEGNFRDTDEDDLHEWTASGDERNALPDSNSDFSGGEVAVIVRWENHGDSSDYKPYLLNPVTEEYIVEGQSGLRTETNQYARISADVAQQPLSVVIENTQGPANDKIEVSVFEGPREIQRNIPASSITAPADVPAALAVAAYELGPRRLAPYSSRGPTDDGRTGVDVTGYTNIEVTDGIFGGTSAAAPYAGGVAALVEENQPGDQSPTELTSTLKSASDDILDPGTDTASGAGVVNTADAVDLGVTQEQEFRLDVTVADDDGTQVKSAVIPDGGQRNVQVRVTARPIDAASGTPFAPVAGQDVTLELTDRTAGELGVGDSTTPEVTVTTTDTGIATTTFRSAVTRSQGTNVTASTRNGDGELFETDSVRGQNLNDNGDQAEIKTVGTLTGDIRDGDGELIRNRPVNVELFKNGNEIENRTIDHGQYNFENLETGDQYRVVAEFQGESGSAIIESLSPGTNTRDIVIRLQETSTSAIDATRSLTSTEVTNGSTVTVTVSANFNSTINDAKVVDTVIGEGITQGNLSLTDQSGGFGVVTSDPEPAVDVTWNEGLNVGLDSDSVTVEYELTIPEDTPVGTTITFDGTVTNVETDGTAGIDGDSSVEVVATTSPDTDTVTVGGQEVPTEFTSETNNGDRTVTADNAVEAINTFIRGDVSADVAVDVINAFIAS